MADADTSPSDQQAMLDLLWGEPPRPSRGPKPTLTREQIARVGIALADAEGLDALTMRRVAEQLGFTTMALYRHVRGKSELIAVMVDTAIGEALLQESGGVSPRELSPPPPSGSERTGVRANLAEAAEPDASDASWRLRLASWADQTWLLYQRHPWLLQADLPGAMIGPHRIAWIEVGLRALDDTRLPPGERLEIVLFINNYVHGAAHLSMRWGQDESQAWTAGSPLMLRVQHDERFPLFRALLADGTLDAADEEQMADSNAASFAFGLARALDGVAAYIATRP